jgi:hypothetical protein
MFFKDSHISSSRRMVVLRPETAMLCMRMDRGPHSVQSFNSPSKEEGWPQIVGLNLCQPGNPSAGLSLNDMGFVLSSRKLLVVLYSNRSRFGFSCMALLVLRVFLISHRLRLYFQIDPPPRLLLNRYDN